MIFSYFADPAASQYIYLNINQLNAPNFIMSLFHASTCFEHVLIVRRSKLYYTASGIITPIGVKVEINMLRGYINCEHLIILTFTIDVTP